MSTIGAVALVCATVIWLSERFGAVIRYRWGPRPETAGEAPMPADLRAIVESYPEEWAQEDTSRALYEQYRATRDWDRVRATFQPPQ